jgi:hypothetical protein
MEPPSACMQRPSEIRRKFTASRRRTGSHFCGTHSWPHLLHFQTIPSVVGIPVVNVMMPSPRNTVSVVEHVGQPLGFCRSSLVVIPQTFVGLLWF